MTQPKVAIVTGAASGIGKASAEALRTEGYEVVEADVDNCDVTDKSAVDALVDATVERYGRLDVMANIAGIMHESTVIDTTEADLDRVLAVNFKGVLFGCQAAARVMTQQRSGSIINMASTAVDMNAPTILCYSVSKVAVVQLTRTLASEVGRRNVRVNAIAPGYIETAMTARHAEDYREMMAKVAPLGRTGQAEDVANAVVWLASDASSFVTGQIVRVNGGVSMPW